MSKAILVINETPKKCYDCQLMTDSMYCKGFTPYMKDGAHITRMCVEDYVMLGTKHPNCPLKPMQRKIVNRSTEKDNQYYYDLGFNDCIDEITKLIQDGIDVGVWYEETDKKTPDEHMIYLKQDGSKYVWKDNMWVRI